MQQQILRNQQQLQQPGPMSYEALPDSQPMSRNIENHPSQCSTGIYRLELTLQQAAYLSSLLPPSHSFQLEGKSLKRGTSGGKNVREPVKLPAETRKKSTKEEPQSVAPKASSSRPQKVNNNRFTEENENAVYQKYNAQKEIKRNTFENVSEALKPCVRVLNLLKNSKTSWPFRDPVDPVALGIPHYTEVVKEPMDLSTVENNLRTNQYLTPTQFHADVSKIITNSYTFNSSNMEFTRVTAEFEAYYRKITSESNGELSRSYSHSDMPPDLYASKSVALEAKKLRKEKLEGDYSQSSGPSISMAEKKELGVNIKKLPKEDMKGILDIVKEGTGKIIGEFDLKELDPAIIRRLQAYVKQKMMAEAKKKGLNHGKNNHENQQESSFEVGEEDQS